MSAAQFRGGPAGGQSFGGLRRVPSFVRVVWDDAASKYDVLNDPEDEPSETERVVGVYVLDETSKAHVRGQTRAASGWWVTYVFLPLLGVEDLRTEDSWCERLAAVVGVSVEVVRQQREEARAT